MARVAHHLVARPGDLAVHRAGPVPLDGRADHDHRAAIRRVPRLHGLERAHDLVVVVTIRQRQHVPPVRSPLVDQAVARELARHHAADQRIVDAGVVVGQEDPEPLADLQRDGLGLELLGVSLGHGELALERDDLRRPHGGAHDVPERRLARGRRDPDARGAAVDVVGEIGGLDVPGQRPDASALGLGEQRMVRQPLVREQRPQRAGAAAESQRVDRQHRDVRRHVIAGIARREMLPVQRLAQDHPQRVAGGCAVSRRQHELVAVRMLGAPVVVAEPAELGPGQVRRDVERRVGQRAAEMPGLGIVAEQGEGHAGHVADVFQAAPVVGRPWRHLRPWRRVNTHRSVPACMSIMTVSSFSRSADDA